MQHMISFIISREKRDNRRAKEAVLHSNYLKLKFKNSTKCDEKNDLGIQEFFSAHQPLLAEMHSTIGIYKDPFPN